MKAGKTLIGGLALMIAVALAIGGYCVMNRTSENPAPIAVDPAGLTIGDVWATNAFPWKLTLHNTTLEPITIAHFRRSCTCTTVRPERLILGPNESKEIECQINLFAGVNEKDPFARQQFAVFMVPEIEGALNEAVGWSIRSNVAAPMTIQARQRGDQWTVPYGEDGGVRTFDVRLHPAIEKVEVECDNPLIDAQLSHKSESGEGKHHVLHVSLTKRLLGRSGPFSGTVRLVAHEHDGRAVGSPILLNLAGHIGGPVEAFPAEVNFGAVNRGQTISEVVAFMRAPKAAGDYRIADVQGGDAVRIEPLSLSHNPDTLATFRVTVDSMREGQHHATATFVIEHRDADRQWQVVVPVSYYLPPDERATIP